MNFPNRLRKQESSSDAVLIQMAWSWLCEEVSIPSLHDKGKWSFLHYLLQNIAIDFDDSGLDENI